MPSLWLHRCVALVALAGCGGVSSSPPAPATPVSLMIRPSEPDRAEPASAVRAMVADDDRACVLLAEQDWRCFQVTGERPTVTLEPLSRADVRVAEFEGREPPDAGPPGTMALDGDRACFVRGREATCTTLGTEAWLDARREELRFLAKSSPAERYPFPFEPMQLVFRVMPPFRQLCARAEAGDVHCVPMVSHARYHDDRGEVRPPRVRNPVFSGSSALEASGDVLFSLRHDGVLEYVGAGACGAAVDAVRNADRVGGGGTGTGWSSKMPKLRPREPEPLMLHDLAGLWPGPLDHLSEGGGAIAGSAVRRLHTASPCVELEDGAVWCWSRHDPPALVDGFGGPQGHPTTSLTRWHPATCSIGRDEVICRDDPEPGGAPGPVQTTSVPAAAQMRWVDRLLCVATDHRLLCLSRTEAGPQQAAMTPLR